MIKILLHERSGNEKRSLKELDNFINKINKLRAGEWNLFEHVNNIVSEWSEKFLRIGQMISVQQALNIHSIAVENFGGSHKDLGS